MGFRGYVLPKSQIFANLFCVITGDPFLAPLVDANCPLRVPHWAARLAGVPDAEKCLTSGTVQVEVNSGSTHSLLTARVADAHQLDAAGFNGVTVEAYRALAAALSHSSTPYALRFWNFIPDIRTPAPGGIDRYMVFNAGRFAALTEWFGGERPSSAHVATATGVGHGGRDLVIHVLAGHSRGTHVENPRQVPSFEYSQQYGPVPPCFARATWIDDGRGGRKLLIGGTSSVCGEKSVHPNDAASQTRETLTNLSHLLVAAGAASAKKDNELSALRDLRVYFVRPADRSVIDEELRGALPAECLARIEFRQAELCRAELLVEIEGAAG